MRMKQGSLTQRMMPFWRTSWQKSSIMSSMPRYSSQMERDIVHSTTEWLRSNNQPGIMYRPQQFGKGMITPL